MRRRGATLLTALLLLVVLFPEPAAAPPPPPRWEAVSPMPTSRSSFAVAELGGKIYAAGGLIASGLSLAVTAEVDVYDPAKDSWSRAADLPTPRQGHVLVASEGVLYLAGGSTSESAGAGLTTSVYWYEPGANAWHPVAPMPEPRIWAVGIAAGASLQVWGGSPDGSSSPSADRFSYGSVIGMWGRDSPMRFGRSNFGATVIGDRVYLTGGWGNISNLTSYNATTGSWEDLPPMMEGRGAHACVSLNGAVWVIGGVTANTTEYLPSTTVESYVPGDPAWLSGTPYPLAVDGLSAVSVGTTLYAMGGLNGNGTTASVYKLTFFRDGPPRLEFPWLLVAIVMIGVAIVVAIPVLMLRVRRRSPPGTV